MTEQKEHAIEQVERILNELKKDGAFVDYFSLETENGIREKDCGDESFRAYEYDGTRTLNITISTRQA